MKLLEGKSISARSLKDFAGHSMVDVQIRLTCAMRNMHKRFSLCNSKSCERGDVPGWVLVVLMTTGLVTAIWTIAAPRLSAILRNSLDSMNGIR